ncbi:sex-lethal homolog isoform X3 [Oratosquilla oratoria]|uniref:sex-lethal homolog isoform X3 n=1 Tax=Oratosquilla oratoria TaxID=337810 RepID=UPI003F758FEC
MSNQGTALPDGETRTNLIINYLPQTLSDQEFYKIFVVVGPIKSCRIMKDLKTGYSFGFGFVEYQKPEDAAKAILQLNNLPVQHKRIKVSYARPPGEDIKETNLYIQNIPRNFTLDQLDELFNPFGNIVQKNLLKDKVTGLPRGVGFVRFDKKSEAENAIDAMNGKMLEGATEPLVVKVAEEHGKMKAAYYAGYHAALRGGRGRGNYNNRGGSGGGGAGYGGARGNYNNMNQRPQGGKMGADRITNRYNPMQGGGGGSGGGGGGNYSAAPPLPSSPAFYNFTTPSFSNSNYTSFSSPSSSAGGYGRY